MLPGKCCITWNIVTIFFTVYIPTLASSDRRTCDFLLEFLQFLADLNHADI